MADYNVDTYSVRGGIDIVLDGLKTKINDIDDAKTLRRIDIIPEGCVFRGILIFDA
jgi:hypothetical protein